jgi:hypothetical protein
MAIAIATSVAAPRHIIDTVRIDITGIPDDVTTYVVKASLAGQQDLVSDKFAAGSGKYTVDGWIFPAAGTWTLKLVKDSDNSNAATQAVTVS